MDEIETLSGLGAKSENLVEQCKIKRQFLLICLAVVLLFSGYNATLLLQSSINIVDGVGANATAVGYTVSVVFGLFFVPFFVRLAGVKWTLLASEFGYLLYVLANCYPMKWLMIIAAALVGIVEASFWVVVGITFVHFGQLYHKHTINRTKESCVGEFSGILFSTFQLNLIFGNTLVFVIFHFWIESENTQDDALSNITSSTSSSMLQRITNVFHSENERLFYCGANDCQNANLTQQNLEKYRPSDLVALYVLLCAFVALMITGIVLQACVTPHIPINFVSDRAKLEEEATYVKNNRNEGNCDVQTAERENRPSIQVMWWKGVKDIFWRALSLEQTLLYLPTIYYGLTFGFLFCEVTRTYASCVKGVSQVGVCMIIYASANSVSAFVFGRLTSKFAVHSIIVVTPVLDLFWYLLCLFWIPAEESSWIVYVIFIMFGISLGMWNILATNIYSESFKTNKELTFTMWCAIFSIGFAIQYGWSTLICVRGKLYIQIALLFASIICLHILRYKSRN